MFRKSRYLVLAGALAFAGATPGVARAQSGAQPVDVTFSLDFIVLGRHAPWFVAVEKGFYREAGLNVKIIPGQGTAQVIQALESGLAEFGFVDVPGVTLGRQQGAQVTMLAVNYQRAPYAIFSLDPGANVTRPEQLKGLEIGSSVGSFTPKVIEGFMKLKGMSPSDVSFQNVAPPARVSMLLARKVPSVEFFVFSEPGIRAAAKDAQVRTLLLSEHGLELYGNGIGALASTIRGKPQLVRAFVGASLKGWQYTLRNPEEAADLLLKHNKALKRDVILEEIKLLRRLAITPDTSRHGLGWFDPATMRRSLEFMVNYIGVDGAKVKPQDLYDASFLPEPGLLP